MEPTQNPSMLVNPESVKTPHPSINYESCIYVTGTLGIVSQFIAGIVLIVHLRLLNKADTNFFKIIIYTMIGLSVLLGQSTAEGLLLWAVKKRKLPFIQWWMTSTLVILLFICLMTVISVSTLIDKALWITLTYLYLVVRLPFQMHFVDIFAHQEIIFKHVAPVVEYDSVVYRRIH